MIESAYGASEEIMQRSPDSFELLPVGSVTPEGWLKDQMGLVNDLQKRLGADPAVSRDGKWTNGEILPRYVRGLCLLAGTLNDPQLRAKAESFVSAIFDSADRGGDIGAQAGGGLAAKIEAVKAVLSFYELTGDERAATFLRKFFKNQFNTLSVTPMWYNGRARLSEEIPAIAAVGGEDAPVWLKELAAKLATRSCDWQRLADRFPFKRPFEKLISPTAVRRVMSVVRSADAASPERRAKYLTAARADAEWKKPSHRLVVETDGVNLAKAVKYPVIYDSFFGYAERETLSLKLAGALERYHGNATGMFASDPKLAGVSAVRSIDIECAAEFTESLVEVLAATGEAACADIIESIVYNVMGRAATEDVSSVADVVAPNLTEADPEIGKGGYPYGTAYVTGAPSRGAIALLSVYPVFLRSVCMKKENRLNFFSYAPCTVNTDINGAKLRIKLETGYPFRNTVVFRVEEADGDVSVTLNFRVPRRTTMQLISGGQVVASGERDILVKCILRTGSTFMLKLNIPLTVSANRDGTVSLYKGSLLMAGAPGETWRRSGANSPARSAHPIDRWAYAPVLGKRPGMRFNLAENERTVVNAFSPRPLSHTAPPFALKVLCRNIANWECDEYGRPVLPQKPIFAEEGIVRNFVPFCCTAVGISHFPVCR